MQCSDGSRELVLHGCHHKEKQIPHLFVKVRDWFVISNGCLTINYFGKFLVSTTFSLSPVLPATAFCHFSL